MKPRVDVIVPVLDGRRHIGTAVESVLRQADASCRVIVVDAGSTDGTVDLLRSWRDPQVTVVHGAGRLLAGAARNLGVAHAGADRLAFLDSDDLWAPGAAQALAGALTDPTSQLAVGRVATFREGTAPELGAPTETAASMVGTVLMARGLFERVGEFDSTLRVGEFVDWLARARSLGVQEVAVPVVALYRRSHAANTSRTRRGDYATDVLRIAQRHRARQRGST